MSSQRPLYAVLNVTSTATDEDIREAYRALAQKLHPDRNPGDEAKAAEFVTVQQAYEVLSDPVTRAHYDATGEMAPPREDRAMAPYLDALSNLFANTLKQVMSRGQDPARIDLLGLMREALQCETMENALQRQQVKNWIDIVKATAGRFTFNGEGDNLLQQIALSHVRNGEAALELVENNDKIPKKLLEILKDTGYQTTTDQMGEFIKQIGTSRNPVAFKSWRVKPDG